MIWLGLLAIAWLILAAAFLLYIAAGTRRRDEEPHP
jgi:hypothetical protein